MVHHAMPTTNCNTSNTRVFDPFNPPTSGSASACASSHLWDRRATYHCSSSAPHEPPSCLCRAHGWGYVGDLQVQDTGYLTSLSIDGEYTSIPFSELRGSLLPASATLLVENFRTPGTSQEILVPRLGPASSLGMDRCGSLE